jgi:hypothetical protein
MEVRLLVSSQASVVVGNLHDECIFALIMMGVGRRDKSMMFRQAIPQ